MSEVHNGDQEQYHVLTLSPVSSGHNFIFKTFAAIDSTSLQVSSAAMAAKTRTPLPIDDTKWVSTVTEADATR